MNITRYYDQGWRYGYMFKRGPSWLHIISTETGDTLKLPATDERFMKTERAAHSPRKYAKDIRRRLRLMNRNLTKTQKEALTILNGEIT
jgi:hypothetical protein